MNTSINKGTVVIYKNRMDKTVKFVVEFITEDGELAGVCKIIKGVVSDQVQPVKVANLKLA